MTVSDVSLACRHESFIAVGGVAGDRLVYLEDFMDESAQSLSNEAIDVDGLPRLRDEAFVSVEARHVIGTIVGLVVLAVALGLVGAALADRTDRPAFLVVALAVAAVLVVSAGMSWLAARRMSYQVREHDLSLRSGLITRTEATVPYRRVQHVHLSRGLLERGLGLATLSINSAGPDISVPGLPVEVATTLRAWIVERAGLDAETVTDTSDPDGSIDDPTGSGLDGAPPWPPPVP